VVIGQPSLAFCKKKLKSFLRQDTINQFNVRLKADIISLIYRMEPTTKKCKKKKLKIKIDVLRSIDKQSRESMESERLRAWTCK